jgi:hypothetical protein
MLALVGVIIGALVTGGVTLTIGFVQTRRERAVARRLAAADLADASRAVADVETHMRAGRDWPVGGVEEDRAWPAGWERANWLQSWQSYRQTLAGALTELQFAEVARAFGIMAQLQTSLNGGQRPFTAADEAFVDDVAVRLLAARQALPLAPAPVSDPVLPAGNGSDAWPGLEGREADESGDRGL